MNMHVMSYRMQLCWTLVCETPCYDLQSLKTCPTHKCWAADNAQNGVYYNASNLPEVVPQPASRTISNLLFRLGNDRINRRMWEQGITWILLTRTNTMWVMTFFMPFHSCPCIPVWHGGCAMGSHCCGLHGDLVVCKRFDSCTMAG
jgi:hypothetical protein